MWQPMVSSEKEMKRSERHIQKVLESCTTKDHLSIAAEWFMTLEKRGTIRKNAWRYLSGILRGIFVGIEREDG